MVSDFGFGRGFKKRKNIFNIYISFTPKFEIEIEDFTIKSANWNEIEFNKLLFSVALPVNLQFRCVTNNS